MKGIFLIYTVVFATSIWADDCSNITCNIEVNPNSIQIDVSLCGSKTEIFYPDSNGVEFQLPAGLSLTNTDFELNKMNFSYVDGKGVSAFQLETVRNAHGDMTGIVNSQLPAMSLQNAPVTCLQY